jgi:hypothetical protein
MPIGSGRVGRSGVKAAPGKGPHRGLAWHSPALSQVNPPHILDASVSTYPTAFADVRASSATYFNSSGVLSTAASNASRVDYNPATRALRGLLVEDTATNIILGSNDFSDGSQTFDGTSRTANATTSPDGTTNAIKLVEAATTAEHRTYQHISGTIAGTSFIGVFAKAAERSWIKLINTNSPTCNFNLATGTIGTNNNTTNRYMIDCGNGWWLCAFTFPDVVGGTFAVVELADADGGTGVGYSYAGNGTSGAYIYGLSYVPGATTLTSYIPATTASATRAADAISFTLNSTATSLTFTFDDGSNQTVTGLTGGSTYTIPTNLNRPWILYIDDNAAAVPSADGVGSAAGAGTATAVGQAIVNADGSAAGSGAATATGKALFSGDGAAAGSGTATATGKALFSGVGSAAGAGTATATGASLASSVGSATGAGTASGVGQNTAASAGAAAGSGTASGVGASTAASVGSAAGAGTATAVGKALFSGVGSAAGSGTASAVGASNAASIGSATGSGTATAVGRSTAAAVGSASGAGTATATGKSLASGVGNAAGAGSATGISVAGVSTGTATGSGTATGVGASIFKAVGTAAGSATVTATGVGAAQAVGTAAGAGSATAVGIGAAQAVGTAAGAGSAFGVGSSSSAGIITSAVGAAAGRTSRRSTLVPTSVPCQFGK